VTWDPRKRAANQKKHGVDFAEAASVFLDPLSTTFPDPDHSHGEQRYDDDRTVVSKAYPGSCTCGSRGGDPHHQRATRDSPRAEVL